MKNITRTRFTVTMIVCIVLAIFLNVATYTYDPAYAEETTASNVLTDLHKDAAFQESEYPLSASDASLKVIQIAESTNQELLVYVYQPSGQSKKLIASSINVSTTSDFKNPDYKNYGLTLLNASGVFFKYAVKDFRVSSASKRYYTISSILRYFNEAVGDKQADYENKVTEVPYEVAKQYCFVNEDGTTRCEAVDIETITITEKFVGFVRYYDGFNLYLNACDSHFIAFDTDRPIDKLMEADVSFEQQSYSYTFAALAGAHETFGEPQKKYAYLTADQHVDYEAGGLFGRTYKWSRIETVKQFLEETVSKQKVFEGVIFGVNSGTELKENAEESFKGLKWVLRFVETPYFFAVNNTIQSQESTLIENTLILRLKFQTAGKTYNLGVIDNKQTGSKDPINKPPNYEITPGKAADIAKILAAIALLIGTAFLIYELIKTLISMFGKD